MEEDPEWVRLWPRGTRSKKGLNQGHAIHDHTEDEPDSYYVSIEPRIFASDCEGLDPPSNSSQSTITIHSHSSRGRSDVMSSLFALVCSSRRVMAVWYSLLSLMIIVLESSFIVSSNVIAFAPSPPIRFSRLSLVLRWNTAHSSGGRITFLHQFFGSSGCETISCSRGTLPSAPPMNIGNVRVLLLSRELTRLRTFRCTVSSCSSWLLMVSLSSGSGHPLV